MHSLENHHISLYGTKTYIEVTDKTDNGNEVVLPLKAHDSSKTSQKSVIESKKTHEFAVVHFSNRAPLKAKSMLTYSINQTDLSFYSSSTKLFKRYAEMEAEIIAFEVKAERADKRNEELWTNVKNAFNERLKNLELKRQKKQ